MLQIAYEELSWRLFYQALSNLFNWLSCLLNMASDSILNVQLCFLYVASPITIVFI